MNIFVSGSTAYDKIMDFPGKFSDHILPNKIHNINVSFGIQQLTVRRGGSAANITYTLGLLKEKPYLISQVGNDFATYAKAIRAFGVQLQLLRTILTETCPTAHIITDKANNQITGFHFGAMAHAALDDKKIRAQLVQRLKTGLKTGSTTNTSSLGILAAGNVDDMMYAAKLYQQYKVPYIFDPGQQIPWLTKDQIQTALRGASILIVNDYELSMVEKKLGSSLKLLRTKLDKIIVTLGSKGSYWYTEGALTKYPVAKPKQVVDPTGAGDAYRAGLIKGLIQDWPDAVTARAAALCATYAIEQYGTQEHSFTGAAFTRRFSTHFGAKYSKQLTLR